jgi:hypothetical protein
MIIQNKARNKSLHAALAGFLALSLATSATAATLEPGAVKAFERYVQQADARLAANRESGNARSADAFLWVKGLPESQRTDTMARLRGGNVITSRFELHDARNFATPGALIHHWIGTVFIPGASLPQVLALVQDYNRHQEYYRPEVVMSKTLARDGNHFKVYLRLMRKKIIKVVLDTEYDVRYELLDSTSAVSRSRSTRIVEVEHAGASNERTLPPGDDNGFLWRLDSNWRFLEADGGVYVECEAISLTRDVPTGLHWLIGPFIESIPKESLEFTLRSTRAAVLQSMSH